MSAPPRDFREWMRMVERRAVQSARTGNSAVVKYVDDKVSEVVNTGGLKVPAAPVELVPQTALYLTRDGRYLARLTLDFPDVTRAADGSPIEVDHYELWASDETNWNRTTTGTWVLGLGRLAGETITDTTETGAWTLGMDAIGATYSQDDPPPPAWSRKATSVISSFVVDGFVPASQWSVRVRAVAAGRPGGWSAAVRVVFGEDTTPPPIPSEPAVTAEYGVLLLSWDGQTGSGAAWPGDFAYVEVAEGASASPEWLTGDRASVATTFSYPGRPYDEPRYFRIRAVDTSGNASAWTASVSATPRQLVSIDIVDLDERLESEANQQREAEALAATKAEEARVARLAAERAWAEVEEAEVALTEAINTYGPGSPEANQAQAVVDSKRATAQTRQAEADQADAAARTAAEDAGMTLAYRTWMGSTGKASLHYSLNQPDRDGEALGETWFQRNTTGAVIGQWEWDGTTWQPRHVASEVIANLDVGKLTAGVAGIDTLVAQKIAAEVGEFIDLQADNFSANLIRSDFIDSGAIQGRHLSLGTVDPTKLTYGIDELLPNPTWNDPTLRAYFPAPERFAYVAEPQPSGQTHVVQVDPGFPEGSMRIGPNLRVSPGDKFFLAMVARRPFTVDWAPALALRVLGQDESPVVDGTTPVVLRNDGASRSLLGVNLVPNSGAETDVSGWAITRGTLDRDVEVVHAGGASFRMTKTVADGAMYALVGSGASTGISVSTQESYRLAAWVRPSTNTSVTLQVYEYDPNGAVVDTQSRTFVDVQGGEWTFLTFDDYTPSSGSVTRVRPTITTPSTLPAGSVVHFDEVDFQPLDPDVRAGQWEHYEAVVEVPAGGFFVAPVLHAPTGGAGQWHISQVSMRKAMTSTSVSGQRAVLSPQGLELWGKDDDGDPSISLTTADAQSLEIRDMDDNVVAAMTNEGQVIGKELVANEVIRYRGRDLAEYFAPYPLGIQASAYAVPSLVENIDGTWRRVLGVTWLAQPGRNYRLAFNGLQAFSDVAGQRVKMKMCYSVGGLNADGSPAAPTPPSATTIPLDSWYGGFQTANRVYTTGVLQAMGSFTSGTAPLYVQAIVFIAAESGTGRISYDGYSGHESARKAARLWVEDVGPDVPDVGSNYFEQGTAPVTPPPPSKVTYEKEWAPTGWKSFMYNGSREYSGSGPGASYAMQGYTSYWSAGGIQKSHIYFNSADIRANLSGASINRISVYIYSPHWYSASGGVARIHRHNYDGSPGSAGSMTHMADAGMGRGEGKWVGIGTAFGYELRDGVARGIGFDSIGSTSSTYYGYFDPWRTRIRVNYTK